MAIEVPTFENTHGSFLSVCGRLKGVKAGTKQKVKSAEKVARYRTSTEGALMRASATYGKDGTYLHVDCALKRYFPKNKIPKVTHKKQEVLAIIEKFQDKEIESRIIAGFLIPLQELSENSIFGYLSNKHKLTDMAFQLTRGELSISGAPFDIISWSISEEGEKAIARIHLQGNMLTKVEKTYLSDCWDFMNSIFELFVLRELKDATSKEDRTTISSK